MKIDPKVKKLVLFSGGGGIVERSIKLSLNQGINEFQIQNVPASFNPDSTNIKLEYINPEDKEYFELQQTIVALPDRKNVQQLIDREKSAATSIISYAIDFTREMRERVSSICEASSYRVYADMNGTFDFIINAKKEGEIIVKILYFMSDLRIRWSTSLQVNISEDSKTAEIETFLIVDNQTGFSYENVELNFAIFDLPSPTPTGVSGYTRGPGGPPGAPMPQQQGLTTLRNEMLGELNRLKSIQKGPMKRTQRLKML